MLLENPFVAKIDVFVIDELVQAGFSELRSVRKVADWIFPPEAKPLVVCSFHRIPKAYSSLLLTDAEWERAGRLRCEGDRLTFMLAHSLLRGTLAAMSGLGPEELEFVTGPYGRPRLSGEASSNCFSLSYRRGLIAIATASAAVGVDIEYVDKSFPHCRIANRCFLPIERERLRDMTPARQLEAFFDVWTRKEAVVKAAGMRVQDGFGVNVLEQDAVLANEFGVLSRYRLCTVQRERNYALSVAIDLS